MFALIKIGCIFVSTKTVNKMTTVQNIAKKLVAAGLKKATTQRVNFETIFVGDYTASHLKRFGMNVIMVQPKNGMTCEKIQQLLSDENTEIKNGYVIIK
jgi:hypothetical protein